MNRPSCTATPAVDRDNTTWLAHLRCDGPEQQAALCDLREALLRGLRRALLSYPNDAFLEDVAQDSLIRILERLPQFEGRSRLVTWATSIAIRIALSELRRRRWKDVCLHDVVHQSAAFTAHEAGYKNPESSIQSDQRALVGKMYEVIHRELTEKQRTALLAELKGMPQIEIARHLGSSRNAVYKLTHDARKRLKRGLEAAGYHADDIHAVFAS